MVKDNETFDIADIKNLFLDDEISRCDTAIKAFKEEGTLISQMSAMLYERRKRYIADSPWLFNIIEEAMKTEEIYDTAEECYNIFSMLSFDRISELYSQDILEIYDEIALNIRESKF